jgi:hypothetical protein
MLQLLAIVSLFLLVSCNLDDNTIDNVGDQEMYFDDGNIRTLEDGTKYLVHPDKIRKGIARPGDVKDVIPSIDDPIYVTVPDADDFIEDNELVLAIIYKGVKRVYPLQILVWHEIVNDEIAGDKLLITYCPLCGSGIAFKSLIAVEGEQVYAEFGTSGKLYNSNLVMYDRTTETYWTQVEGRAILGELTGQILEPVSIDTVSWGVWKSEHPDSEVLKRPRDAEGFPVRSYGQDPYGSYYENSNLFFPVENEDNSVHPKTVIFGVNINGVYKAYKEGHLRELEEIDDVVNGVNLKITRDKAGIVKMIDDSGKEYVKERDFWFAWYAFHPDTLLYEG